MLFRSVSQSRYYAFSVDDVEGFTQLIKDVYVHPDIRFTDIIYGYDSRKFFQLV